MISLPALSLKDQLRKSLLEVCTPEDLQQWFEPLDMRMGMDGIVVVFPHALFADWFAKKGQDVFESTVALLSAKAVSDNPQEEDDLPPQHIRYEMPGNTLRQERRLPRKRRADIQEDPTFDDFVGNAKHRNVLHVLRELLPRDPRSVIPVSLAGPPGSGKTHLLRATARRLTHDLGSGFVLTGPDEVSAMEGALSENFRGLLLDDLHRLSADTAVQDTVVRLLDKCLDEGRPFVVAGTGRPAEWPLSSMLRSRLHVGITLVMPEPDMDICLRFMQQRFKSEGFTADKDTLLLLVRRFPDIRRLTGVVRRLCTLRSINGEVSQADMESIARQTDGTGLTPQVIMHLVAGRCGVTVKDILGSKRKPRLVRARQVAMYLCREMLAHSFPAIGHIFGGKDHSTVVHSVQKIKALLASDTDTHILVTELTKSCRKLSE